LISLLLFFVSGEVYLRNSNYYGIEYVIQLQKGGKEEVKIRNGGEFSGLPWITGDIERAYRKLAGEIEDEGKANLRRPFYRIIILGDSIAVGGALEDKEKAFPELLGRFLQRDYPDTDFKNTVFAAGGYSTEQEVGCYEKYCKPFVRPDLVILEYCQNDAIEAYPKILKKGGRHFAAFYKTCVPYLTGIPFNRFLTERFLLARLLNESLIKTFHLRRQSPIVGYCLLPDERIRGALKKLSLLTGANNVPVLVAVFPRLEDPCEDITYARMTERIKQWCGEFNFLYLDLRKEYEAYPMKTLRVVPRDYCHPNTLGHKIAAQAIAEKIESELLNKSGNKFVAGG
jgi:lysophospholipase L1-like esterase